MKFRWCRMKGNDDLSTRCMKARAMAVIAGAVPLSAALGDSVPERDKPAAGAFWPDGVRMVISVSMQMESGYSNQVNPDGDTV
jgi:hypothetical protein